jgi:hypothetical protein
MHFVYVQSYMELQLRLPQTKTPTPTPTFSQTLNRRSQPAFHPRHLHSTFEPLSQYTGILNHWQSQNISGILVRLEVGLFRIFSPLIHLGVLEPELAYEETYSANLFPYSCDGHIRLLTSPGRKELRPKSCRLPASSGGQKQTQPRHPGHR